MKKILSITQGTYYMLSGIWPLVHIESFMLVTGPKTDIWLVKTVGLLSAAIGFSIIVLDRSKSPLVLNISAALSFLIIDVYYTSAGTISAIYLADAFLQFVFLFFLFIWHRRNG